MKIKEITMKSTFVAFAIVLICFQGITALKLPAKFQEHIEKDEKECTKSIIKMMAKEDSGDLGDFHSKSDIDKIKALYAEMKKVMRNGNNFTKHFVEALEDTIDKESDNWTFKEVEEAIKEIGSGEDKLTSCMMSKVFEVFYDLMKKSHEMGRLGDTKNFMAMVKDMMSTVDPEKQNFVESPVAVVAYFTMAIGAVPDFVLSMLSVIVYVPENVWERFFEDFPAALESFNPDMYMESIKGVMGNELGDD